MVNKEARQVEEPRHPGYHAYDVQRLDPGISFRKPNIQTLASARAQWAKPEAQTPT